ncbi:MAG: molecular chaperone TorD family protein [Anaerolineales bacterium]|nr:MAG: molecular chaperone TorD family protein [Anaerolineales bacterium]
METLRPQALEQTQAGESEALARAGIYYALAEALAGPVAGMDSLLRDAALAGARVLDSDACRRAASSLAELPAPDLDALLTSYARLCGPGRWGSDGPTQGGQAPAAMGPGRRPLALYESLHRRGCLGGQPTWDVERHYRGLGLAPVGGELPDHASVELAYLGHLSSAEAEAGAAGDSQLMAQLKVAQRTFLRTHAGAWLPEVGVTLAAEGDAFYAAVGWLLSGFLEEELVGRKRNGRARGHVPQLKEPAACTLCGLCVGSCQFGALRVIENATQTALTLESARCLGCDRCVRTCPEGVLHLSCEAGDGTARQALRQSPRADCPSCGRPTVSQAELEAVLSRLQPDPAIQQRLRLCVACKSWSS